MSSFILYESVNTFDLLNNYLKEKRINKPRWQTHLWQKVLKGARFVMVFFDTVTGGVATSGWQKKI